MKLIKPSHEIIACSGFWPLLKSDWLPQTADGASKGMLQIIELAARNCYKSEDAITCDSAGPFVGKIANVFKHESVVEHASVTVRFICDRGVTHELVRHRLAAYSQESTRYCNYSKSKFGGHCTFIIPPWINIPEAEYTGESLHGYLRNLGPGYDITRLWAESMLGCEAYYIESLKCGCSAQQARALLPNSLKTEIIMTTNLRNWKHIFKRRCSSKAHPQMQEMMKPLLAEFQKYLPELFGDVSPE